MPAWLGWVAVVLLSLYLAIYPALAAGLAWRVRAARPGSPLCSRSPAPGRSPNGCARHVHRLRLEPVGVVPADTHLLNATALIGTYGLSALVVLLGGAAVAR